MLSVFVSVNELNENRQYFYKLELRGVAFSQQVH